MNDLGRRSLTVILVNWRTADLTVKAVLALIDDGVDPSDVVVVDNASGDGSVERIAAVGVEVIEFPENVGFARANNEAARRRPADAYLLVNSDAFVEKAGSVDAMRSRLGGERVGIVIPLLLTEDRTVQPNVAPLPSPLVALVQASGLSRLVPDALQPSLGTYWRHGSERRVEAGTAAVMLVSGSFWEDVGGFDETTFMYAEDRDLCWRARESGWGVVYTPSASFVHLGNASSGDRWSAAQRAERVGSAEAAMIRQHLGRRTAVLTIALVRAGLAVRVVLARALGRSHAAARFAGGFRGYGAPVDRTRR